MDDEGLDLDALEAELRARRRDLVPLHDPDVPEPVRPHDRDRAPPAARRARRRVRPPDSRGRPVRPRPLRRRAAAVDPRARGRRAGHVHVVVLEDGGARACGSATSSCRRRSSPRTTIAPSRPTSRRACCRRRPSTSSCTAVRSSRTSTACVGCSRAARTRCSLRSRPRCPRARRWSSPEGGYFLWLDFAGRRRRRRAPDAGDGGGRHVRPRLGLLPERLGRPVVGAARVQLRDARADRRGRRAPRLAACRGDAERRLRRPLRRPATCRVCAAGRARSSNSQPASEAERDREQQDDEERCLGLEEDEVDRDLLRLASTTMTQVERR